MSRTTRKHQPGQLDLFPEMECAPTGTTAWGSRRSPPKTFFGRRGRKGRAILTPAGRLTLDDAIARSGPPEQIACAQ